MIGHGYQRGENLRLRLVQDLHLASFLAAFQQLDNVNTGFEHEAGKLDLPFDGQSGLLVPLVGTSGLRKRCEDQRDVNHRIDHARDMHRPAPPVLELQVAVRYFFSRNSRTSGLPDAPGTGRYVTVTGTAGFRGPHLMLSVTSAV